jgi:hypothetical protein
MLEGGVRNDSQVAYFQVFRFQWITGPALRLVEGC